MGDVTYTFPTCNTWQMSDVYVIFCRTTDEERGGVSHLAAHAWLPRPLLHGVFGHAPFDPARSLKSAISSLLLLLLRMLQLKPSEGREVVAELVPVACDLMSEFAHGELRKLIKVGDETAFSLTCSRFKLNRCFDAEL